MEEVYESTDKGPNKQLFNKTQEAQLGTSKPKDLTSGALGGGSQISSSSVRIRPKCFDLHNQTTTDYERSRHHLGKIR